MPTTPRVAKVARKLAIVSGKYGGFRAMVPMIRLFDRDPSWETVVYLCDQHLWASRGTTAAEARSLVKEVFFLGTMVQRRQETEREVALLSSMQRLARAWTGASRPDIVIVYGDRLDALLAAAVAQDMGIPVAHLQAGDRSGGTDDARRWAVSAVSKWLFCSSPAAADRCLPRKLDDQHIYQVGDHHLDAVREVLNTGGDHSVAKRMPRPYFVVHMHPDTLASEDENRRVCAELWNMLYMSDKHFAVLPPCNDRLWQAVDDAVPSDDRVVRFSHLPLEQYVPLLVQSAGLMGNSSAALIDAPYLGVPTRLFGNRQAGRDTGPFGDGTAGQQTYEILSREVTPHA